MQFFMDFWNEAIVASWDDLLHVFLRSVIIVVFVFAVFRYLGQRSTSQLNIFGLLLVVGLGSAVGDPMFYRDVNLSMAMLAILVVISAFKILNGLTARFRRLDRYATPEPIPLIEQGTLNREGLARAEISENVLLSLARLQGVESLDQVKTSFLEVNGQVSIIPWRGSRGA